MAEKKTPNRKARRSIAATRRKYVEALDLESAENPTVEFDGLDGQVYSFVHPLFMEDEQQAAVDGEDTQQGKAAALLGEEQWEKFTQHPAHRSADVMLLFQDLAKETQDVMGDGTPTQSSTS